MPSNCGTRAAQALEYLLVSGRLGVVFDGLDELPVIVQRRDIAKNIEAFASRYPQSAVIVTSRVVGYEHSALTADIFRVIELADFSREQAAEYARRWFRLDRKLLDYVAWMRAYDLID